MILEGVLAELQALDVNLVKQETSLVELEDICRNPVFKLLCEICGVLNPEKARKK